MDATGRLLKAAEIKKRKALEEAKQTAKMQQIRKSFWVRLEVKCMMIWINSMNDW